MEVTNDTQTRTAETRIFGPVEFNEEAVIRFEQGLPGFEDQHTVLLLQPPDSSPLVFLQSLAQPSLCFITLPIRVIERDFTLCMSEEDLKALGLPEDRQPEIGADVLCLAILTVKSGADPTANLRSPVAIHLKDRKAIQFIQMEPRYSAYHPLSGLLGA